MPVQGIDVSDHQTAGSFHAVQNAGYGFVFAKATQTYYSAILQQAFGTDDFDLQAFTLKNIR